MNRVIADREIPLQHRPHQEETAAGTVVLVIDGEVGRTRLETESAMDAEIEPARGGRERRSRYGAGGAGGSLADSSHINPRRRCRD
jgi:hypothetical protein